MNGSAKIRSTHRQRQAVVYLRQSSPKQVLENQESAVNQRALRERLIGLASHPRFDERRERGRLRNRHH